MPVLIFCQYFFLFMGLFEIHFVGKVIVQKQKLWFWSPSDWRGRWDWPTFSLRLLERMYSLHGKTIATVDKWNPGTLYVEKQAYSHKQWNEFPRGHIISTACWKLSKRRSETWLKTDAHCNLHRGYKCLQSCTFSNARWLHFKHIGSVQGTIVLYCILLSKTLLLFNYI